jgi:hypothetical protein
MGKEDGGGEKILMPITKTTCPEGGGKGGKTCVTSNQRVEHSSETGSSSTILPNVTAKILSSWFRTDKKASCVQMTTIFSPLFLQSIPRPPPPARVAARAAETNTRHFPRRLYKTNLTFSKPNISQLNLRLS